MAQPAPKKVGDTPTPNATVNITNGVVSSQTVTIPSEGVVAFVADSNDYTLELWDKKNQNHPAVNVYLPADGTIYVIAGSSSNDQNSTCYYNVEFYDAANAGTGLGSGGGNKIIIGSGNTAEG
ncbi:MAG TPA: hypothetical protein VLC94_11200 [Candidatus Acidoferrum sp.]|nr:hypothetical protein [Candidatus Acidoferrum sp.]